MTRKDSASEIESNRRLHHPQAERSRGFRRTSFKTNRLSPLLNLSYALPTRGFKPEEWPRVSTPFKYSDGTGNQICNENRFWLAITFKFLVLQQADDPSILRLRDEISDQLTLGSLWRRTSIQHIKTFQLIKWFTESWTVANGGNNSLVNNQKKTSLIL